MVHICCSGDIHHRLNHRSYVFFCSDIFKFGDMILWLKIINSKIQHLHCVVLGQGTKNLFIAFFKIWKWIFQTYMKIFEVIFAHMTFFRCSNSIADIQEFFLYGKYKLNSNAFNVLDQSFMAWFESFRKCSTQNRYTFEIIPLHNKHIMSGNYLNDFVFLHH